VVTSCFSFPDVEKRLVAAKCFSLPNVEKHLVVAKRSSFPNVEKCLVVIRRFLGYIFERHLAPTNHFSKLK